MKTNSRFSRNVYAISNRIWCNKHLWHTTTENYDNSGKGEYFGFDDDDNISYIHVLSITYDERASWTHTAPYIVMKIKGNRKDSKHINHTSTRHYKHLHVVIAHEQSCMMMIMEGSKMPQTEYDLKAIMYYAFDKPHKLYNISGN